jgi:hypothetical protein
LKRRISPFIFDNSSTWDYRVYYSTRLEGIIEQNAGLAGLLMLSRFL